MMRLSNAWMNGEDCVLDAGERLFRGHPAAALKLSPARRRFSCVKLMETLIRCVFLKMSPHINSLLKRILRRHGAPDDMLHPLARTVDIHPPPEGLLQGIEADLDRLPEPRPTQMPSPRRRILPLLAVSAAVVLVAWVPRPVPPHVLISVTGAEMARVKQSGAQTTLMLGAAKRALASGGELHLWGMPRNGGGPVHLGQAGGVAPLVINAPDRFSHYALSLEMAGFAALAPAGPVLAMSKK